MSAPLAGLPRRARRLADREDVGTEHLLAALLALDSHAATLLRGLEVALISRPAPLPADEPIEFQVVGPAACAPGTSPETTGDAGRQVSVRGERRADTFRILDAAANRGREGLRVVEDYVRFTLNDAFLTGRLKSFRHELTTHLARLGAKQFHRGRDTPGDVGTAIQADSAVCRESPLDVVRANCKRVAESLRTLEEFGKLIDTRAAAALEQLRYRFYTLEHALLTLLQSRDRLAGCRLYLLATKSLCREGLRDTICAALEGGVNAVQLREKDATDRTLIDLARQVRDWTREAGALFFVNDRPDIAALVDADGVHVGQDDLSVRDARRIIGPDKLVGVSTHTIDQARRAVLDGADYLGVGPVFPSQTKQFDALAGLEFVRQAAAEIALPWFAIGGITAENVDAVAAAGARRAAVSSALCGSPTPVVAARRLLDALSSGSTPVAPPGP
jgi:thiamine-phosphate pyrophosphorylase